MEDVLSAIRELREKSKGTRFSRLAHICDQVFGSPRRNGTSHRVYRSPWPGDPRVNIQEGRNGLAKPYQVRQVVKALERIEELRNSS